MKKIALVIASIVIGSSVFAQSNCSLVASAATSNIICGQTVQLTSSGAGGAILMNNDFNTGTAGPGWSVSASAQFNNPCGPSLDGSTHMWMGNTTAAPRTMSTIAYNIACTGNICFDLKFASTFTTPCEEPDLSTEGVDLMYSTNGGATWTSIFYFDPLTGLYDNWANYCFTIPAGAVSPNTMFSWSQTNSSGNDFDHWGIDNVNITLTGACATPAPYYYSWLPTTGLSNPAISNPVASPLTTTTYTLYFTNGIDDTCTATIPINVVGPTADAGVMQSVCLGQSATLNGSGSSNLPAASTYSSTTTTAIPDNTTVTNAITVSGLPYTTIPANAVGQVCMQIDHTWDSDLDIFLSCPDGTLLELTTDNGGASDNYGTPANYTCFSMSATQNITAATHPYTGTYLPEGAAGLNAFTGCTANGNWVLEVTDDVGGDVGTINNWNITFVVPAVTTASWSPTTNMTGSTTLTPTVTPTVSGSTQYTLTVSGNPGCTATDTVTLQVTELSGVTVSPGATICESDSTQLNATGGTTYAWSPVTGLSSSSIANPVASPTNSTNYTVTISNGSCASVQTVSVTVNPRPATDAGTNVAYCMGDSVQLNATGADTYTWLPTTGLSNPAIANPIANGSSPLTTYTVTGVITATGCFRTDSISIQVNPNPVANAGVDTSYCFGGSVGLLATGGGTYNWLPATNISNSTVANPTVNPAGSMSYTLTVTNTFGCIDKDTININVRSLPVVNAGTNSFACPGAAFTPPAISVTGAAPFTYAWTPAGTISDPTILAPAFTPTVNPTIYTLTATDTFGCVASDVVTISLRNLPNVTASAQNPNICPGATTNLAASFTGAPAPVSYTWTPTASVTSPNTASTPTAASVTVTTTYTVSYTTSVANGGCVDSRTVTVTILPVPTANAGTDVNLCPGSTAVLNGSGGGTYLWAPAAGLDDPTLQNPTTSASTQTQYTVTVTDASGCTDTASVWALTHPNPVVGLIDSTATGCLVPSGTLTMQPPAVGTAPFTYALNGGTAQASNTFTGLAAGNYTLTVTDSYGCFASDDATVLQSLPPVPGIIDSTAAGCTVANGTLTMQAPTGNGPFMYSLNAGTPQTSNVFTGLTVGNFTITVIDANGCAASDDANVLQSLPPIAGVVDSTAAGCTVANGTLTMQAPTGIAPFMYNLNGGVPQASNVFSGLIVGNYTVTVIDANGCTASDDASVIQSVPPVAGIVDSTASACTSATGTLTMQAPTGVGPFTYSLNGGLSQASNTFINVAVGNYTITVTDANGCTASDASSVIQQNPPVMTGLTAAAATCAAANGSITIAAPSGGTAPYTYQANAGTPQASALINGLITGLYTITVTDAGGCSDTDTITVPQQLNTITMDTVAVTSTVCGATPASGSINVVATGGVAPFTGGTAPYTYSINGGLTYQASPLFSGLATNNYPVVVKDANGCISSTNAFYVGANITTNAAFTATPISGPAPLVVTLANNSMNATNYIWSYPDSSVAGVQFSTATTPPEQTFTNPGVYLIQLTAYNNSPFCASNAWYSITVFDKPSLVIPNVITPNNDGINDVFKLSGSNFKKLDVAIFDRWGRQVTTFEGDINTAVWKPTGVSEGTYFVTIIATSLDETKEEFSGFLTILDVK